MTLVLPNVGEQLALKLIVNKTTQGNLKLHLFKTNVTPGETDTVTTYTECDAAGYGAITLTGATWTVATDGSGNTTASYPQQTFTFTATQNVYGYYLTDNAGTTLLYAEAFPSVFPIPSGGGSVAVL